MRFSQSLILIVTASLASLAFVHTARTEQKCAAHVIDPRLDITMPVGCMSDAIIRKQIENPADLTTPRPETSADTGRRLKSLSDWRNGKAKSDTPSEGQK